MVALQALLQLGIHSWLAIQALFRVGGLSAAHAALAVLLGLIRVSVIEILKLVRAVEGRSGGT